MKKKLFRKNSPATKVTAAVLSVTLAFGMTPAVALAQPAAEPESGITALSDSDVAAVKALIAALPKAQDVTAAEKGTYDSQIKAAVDAFNALGEADQQTLDTTNVDGGDQSYGRILECAEWAMKAKADCDNSTTLADNTYTETTTPALSSEYSKGKSTSSRQRPWSITDVTVAAGKATGTVTVKSPTYDYIYMGGKKIENSAPSGSNSVFKNVPIDLNSTQYLSAHSTSMGTEIVFSITSTIDESPAAPETVVTEIPTENITNATGMFKVVSASIETTGDKVNLRFALSSTGYGDLFMGTFDQCIAAEPNIESQLIHYTTNEAGKYEFVVPVEAGENTYAVAALSTRNYAAYKAGTKAFWQCVYPRMFKLDIDAETLWTGDYEGQAALAASVTGKAPAVTAATLDTVGGPQSNGYSETAIITTDATAAYMGTAEAASLATEGIIEAANGALSLPIVDGNRGGLQSYDGTFTEAIAFKQADGTWIDTTVTLNKNNMTLTIAGAAVPTEPPATATVSYSAQAAGAYLAAPAADKEVSGDLAESYGYADSITASEGVSAADVMVAAAIDVFGEEAFTTETAKTMLDWSDSGWVKTYFGTDASNGFFVNHATPNDGTESSFGGYNGTMITTTKVNSGDFVEFYTYQSDSYADKYTYVEAPAQAFAGASFDVTVTGVSAMNGYLYKDAAAMKAAATALQGVKLATVDATTGAVTELEGVVTNAEGKATVTLPEGGDYYLTACGSDSTNTPVIMNPTKVSVVEGLAKGHYSIDMKVLKPNKDEYGMFAPVDPVVNVTDEGIFLTFRVERKTYYGVFLGAKEDASQDSDRYFAATQMKAMSTKGTVTDVCEFTLKLSEEELNMDQNLTLFGGSKNTWYGTQLTLSLSGLSSAPGVGASAQRAIDAINAIPAPEALTYSDGDAIRAARIAYDVLNSVRVTEVTNLDKLVAAEEAYSKLPIIWPALPSGYDAMNGNAMVDDPYFMVAYNDNQSNIFVRLYVDSRNYNRAFKMAASEVTAETTGGTLTAVADSDAGYISFSAKEVQLGKTYHYTLAKITDGELKATKEISFTLPSFRGYKALDAGTYEMALQSDLDALNGIAATVVSDGTAMTATVTPKTAITKAFAGTAEAAAAATEGFIEPNEQGAFVLPIAQTDIPTALAVFDGTKWTDQRIQVIADEATQNVINAIQNIYRDGVDENGKALTRDAYWDIYPADRDAVNAANAAYQTLTDAQKLVVGQSNESELLHAVAMFKAADSVSAEIATLPATVADIKTQDDVNAIKAVKDHYDTCGSNIFDWYPDGQTQGIQARYVQKLIPTADKEKLAILYDALQNKLALAASADTVKPGETVTIDIVASAPLTLSCAQFKIAASENLKLTSITKGAGLNLTAATEGAANGSFEATIDNGVVTFYGNTADAAQGIVVATATFEALTEGDATVSVSDAVFGASGNTMDIEDIVIPDPAKISVAYAGDFKVSEAPFVEASGIKMITFVGDVAEGQVVTMKGAPMLKLGESFVALATADEAAALTRADFDLVEGDAQVVAADGDVNMNGKVNIVDAQLAYDIARAVYTDFSAVTMEGFLKADVNGDASVDAVDAFAIQHFALVGTFSE